MTSLQSGTAGSWGDRGARANGEPMVTRTVTCPRCRAEAMLTYRRVDDAERRQHPYRIVYVCPNMCALPPGQVLALIGSGD